MQVPGPRGSDTAAACGPLHAGNGQEQPLPQRQAPVGAAAGGAVNGGAQQGEAAAEDGMTAHTKSLKTEQQQQPLSPHQESESDLVDLVTDDARGDGNFVPCMQGKLH